MGRVRVNLAENPMSSGVEGDLSHSKASMTETLQFGVCASTQGERPAIILRHSSVKKFNKPVKTPRGRFSSWIVHTAQPAATCASVLHNATRENETTVLPNCAAAPHASQRLTL